MLFSGATMWFRKNGRLSFMKCPRSFKPTAAENHNHPKKTEEKTLQHERVLEKTACFDTTKRIL